MTVGELIDELQQFDLDQLVYVVDGRDQTIQTVKTVGLLRHANSTIPGVVIPPDVLMVPWAPASMLNDQGEEIWPSP